MLSICHAFSSGLSKLQAGGWRCAASQSGLFLLVLSRRRQCGSRPFSLLSSLHCNPSLSLFLSFALSVSFSFYVFSLAALHVSVSVSLSVSGLLFFWAFLSSM